MQWRGGRSGQPWVCQHNNQLTNPHEGSDVLVVQCATVEESLTRQPHWIVATNSLLHLELSDTRKLVIIVILVYKNLVHEDLCSRPNLSTNVKRKLSKGFLDVQDEIVDVLCALTILKLLNGAEEGQVKYVAVRGVRRLTFEANVPPACVHLCQMGIYLGPQPSRNWVGWSDIHLDSHWPLHNDSWKMIIEINLNRFFLADLETLCLERFCYSIFGASLCRN